MSCSQLVEALSETISAATIEADALQNEIDTAYNERAAAEKAMHEAAARKDAKGYRTARADFDMLTEFIDAQEREHNRLTDGSLLTPEDRAAIRSKLYSECSQIETAAALKIADLLQEADRVKADMQRQIGERNSVFFVLNDATRPKNAEGNPRGPESYAEVIVSPFLNEIENARTPAAASFRIYVRDHRK